jgi:hypothetical protein
VRGSGWEDRVVQGSIGETLQGNLVVYAMLAQRQVPVRLFWAGTPGYLVRVCSENAPQVGNTFLWFARSTVIAFLVCILLAPALFHGR